MSQACYESSANDMPSSADSLYRSGEWLDGFGYALLADEWRDR